MGTADTQQGTNPGAWPGVAETAEDWNTFRDKAQEGGDLPSQGSPQGLSSVAMTEKLQQAISDLWGSNFWAQIKAK